MPDPIRPDDDPHDEADALLPWYATGQLDSADRALVASHLASCARCQRQLLVERRLIDEFHALTPEVDSGWTQLRAWIEARPAPGWMARAAGDFWSTLSRPGVAALAAAQVAFVIFAGLMLSLSRPVYHALGSPQVSNQANVIVIFRPDATEQDIRDALRASSASLVGGPTSSDAYLLSVPANTRQTALAKLQSDDNVQLAEPIDGARP